MKGGEFSPAVVASIVTRDRECCARCGKPVRGSRGRDWSVHHRRPRGAGGTSLRWVGQAANGVVLCGSGTTGCHGAIERERRRAFDDGFLISRIGVAVAVTTVLRHALHGWVLLDDEGGFSSAEGFGAEWAEVVDGGNTR